MSWVWLSLAWLGLSVFSWIEVGQRLNKVEVCWANFVGWFYYFFVDI